MWLKRNIYINVIAAAVIMLALAGCQNDGQIGWIFGTWRVEKFTVDGVDASTELTVVTTFSFQNNIVQVVAPGDVPGDALALWGTWCEDGESFTLDFTHSDLETPSGTGIYGAPWWLMMSSGAPMTMRLSHSRNYFTLTWISSEGTTNVYEFAKTW